MTSQCLKVGDFARSMGFPKQRATEWVRAGLPVRPDGLIDPEAGEAWVAANVARRRGGARLTAAPGKMESVAALRGKKLEREGALLSLELKRRTGEVVDRGEAEAAIFGRARQERDVWLSFASRASAALAAEGIDPTRSFATLDRLVRETLGELAATPLKLVG